MDAPAISVVVCTRARPALLEGCLEALAAQDHERFEVIVVDNAPATEAARTVADRYDVRYVIEPLPGLNRARNRGLAAARGAIVAYTDDDARPAPDWVTALERRFAGSQEVASVTGRVVAAELSTRAQLLFEHAYRGMSKGGVRRLHRRRSRLTFVLGAFGTGCNMAFRHGALTGVGGFDPALDAGTISGGGGDLDLFQRLFERGRTIEYAPEVVVGHIHRRTLPALHRQLYDNGRGYSAAMTAALLRAPWRRRPAVIGWWLAWVVWWFGRRVVLRLLRRHPLPLSLVLSELAGAVSGGLLYLTARRLAGRSRRTPHAALLRDRAAARRA